jgi:hypothetical protein
MKGNAQLSAIPSSAKFTVTNNSNVDGPALEDFGHVFGVKRVGCDSHHAFLAMKL